MKQSGRWFFLILALAAGVPARSAPVILSSDTPLITQGAKEQFEYTVHWNGLEAGRITMTDCGEIDHASGSRRCFQAEGNTTGIIKHLYQDHRVWKDFMYPDCRPFLYEEHRDKSGWERRKYMVFDRPEQHLAAFYKHEKFEKDVPYPPGAFGPGSALQKVRYLPLQTGTVYQLSIVEGDDIYRVPFSVHAGKKQETILGKVNPLIIKPVFYENEKLVTGWSAEILVTPDVPHIPVQLNVSTKWGRIQLRLKNHTPPAIVTTSANQ